ncbi:hypothetical protein MTO96_023980 [Rhipicephalus appendiculatus]
MKRKKDQLLCAMSFSCVLRMMQALLVIVLSIGQPAGAQNKFRDILSSLASEMAENSAETSGSVLIANASTAAAPTTRPRGLGLPCNADAECLASRGLSCQFWVCTCAPQTPVAVVVRGEPTCVPARSLYQPCRFHQECNHTSGPMRCVEGLCLCPIPFEPTEKGGMRLPCVLLEVIASIFIVAQPSLVTRLVGAATPTTIALVVAAALVAAFVFARMLPRSRSRSGSTTSDERCSAQAPPWRKCGPAEASPMEIPRHLRGLPMRQNAPERALPIRRIRMPPVKAAGPATSAAASIIAIASSTDSVVVETSTAMSPPTSVLSNETKVEESSRPRSVSSKAISPCSDDVAAVHVSHKSSTTSPAGIGLLPVSARLLPLKSATSALSLSIKWGGNKSSTSSLNRTAKVRKKTLKSAMMPGKAVLPDDDDSEVPWGLASYGRQRSVAFADTKPNGGEPSSLPEASEDKEQSSTTGGVRGPMHSGLPGTLFSQQCSTTEVTEEATLIHDTSCSSAAPSTANEIELTEHPDGLDDGGIESVSTNPSAVLLHVASGSEVFLNPDDVAPESSRHDTRTDWEARDYLEPVASSLVDPGNVELHDATRGSSVEKVVRGTGGMDGINQNDLQGESMVGTPCESESGFAVEDLLEVVPSSIKATSTSGLEAHMETVELWEHGRVIDVGDKGRAVTSTGSFTAVEERSTESVASIRCLSEMARAPLDTACSSYSDLQSQNWPPAYSRSAWSSLEKVGLFNVDARNSA